MRDVSEQLMLAKNGGEYITDGLILCADGRDDVGASKTILNRVSNTYNLVPRAAMSTIDVYTISNENGFYVFRFHPTANIDVSYGSAMGADAQTIEAVVGVTPAMFMITGAGGYWPYFWNRGTSVRYAWGADRYKDIEVENVGNMPLHITVRPSIITINGENYQAQNISRVTFDAAFLIRHYQSWSTPDVCQIGAIRAYDRVLSDEEVLQNYNYEKSLGRVN